MGCSEVAMSQAENPRAVRIAFIKLHISILLAGFTGVLGKLITISEGMLVWYRVLFTLFLFLLILGFMGKLHRVPWRDFLRIGMVGVVLCLHWVLFYGSIKASNVSIGVVCFALLSFFTALLEPFMLHRKFSLREISLSMLPLLGILLIFSLDTRYQLGIAMGVCSTFLAAIFTILNKKVSSSYPSEIILFYEMVGGFCVLSLLLPLYIYALDITYVLPTINDFIGLLLLAFFCTIGLYLLLIQAVEYISAFTVNLSYNLEPVYSILIAIFFLHEGRDLNFSFYIGLFLISISVVLQNISTLRAARSAAILKGRK